MPETPTPFFQSLSPATPADSAAEDADWMRRVAAGEQEALRLLMRKHMASSARLAYRVLGNTQGAEDVAQEAFIRVWKAAPGWAAPDEKGAKFTTWLYRIVMNLAIDEKRKGRSVGFGDGEMERLADPARTAEEQMLARQQSARVQQALAALPERQRAAFALCFYEGVSNKDAADILGVGVKGLESLLVRARRGLRELLMEERGA